MTGVLFLRSLRGLIVDMLIPKSEWRGKFKSPHRLNDGYCVYCKTYTTKLTWDHALKRSTHPEFKNHPLNLVPACGQCNYLKGAGWKPKIWLLPKANREWLLQQRGVDRQFEIDRGRKSV